MGLCVQMTLLSSWISASLSWFKMCSWSESLVLQNSYTVIFFFKWWSHVKYNVQDSILIDKLWPVNQAKGQNPNWVERQRHTA